MFAWEGQKKVLDPLRQKLQTVVSYHVGAGTWAHVGAGTWARVIYKADGLLTTELSLAPPSAFLDYPSSSLAS